MRVGPAAGLHVTHILRVGDVADVEDADPADPLVAHRVLDALCAAVQAPAVGLAGDEQQVLVDRDIALRSGTNVAGREHRLRRIGDVPDLVPIVVALDRVLTQEGEIRIRVVEFRGLRRVRDEPHVPRRFTGIGQTGLESYPRVGARRGGSQVPAGCRGRGGGRRGGGLGRRRWARGLRRLGGGLGTCCDQRERQHERHCWGSHLHL